MRSLGLFLVSASRSLCPPIDLRKLAFRGGWAGAPIYVVMLLMYPASLAQAGWVDLNTQFTYVTIAGALLGTIVGNGRMPSRRSTLLGIVAGALTVVIFTIIASTGPSVHLKTVDLATHVDNWVTQILAGESANDPSVFVLLLGATCWAGAYAGAFALARTHRPWDAVVFSGASLTINVSLALTSLYFDLILFTLLALVLLTRLHIVNLMERWERNNIVPAGEMDWRILRGGLTWTLVLIMLAFFTPRVAAADLVSNAFNTFEGPYQRIQAEWQRFFGGVSGPSRLQGVSFSDAIRLGQAPNLGDRIVFYVDAPAAHFWRAVTYDFYTGAGWRTTETDRVDKATPYDKAEAIETYLRKTYKYSTVVKPAPAGRDPVDYFLFDLKADFCEYFASSMAVMLREVGVPARVVEGFTAGELDPLGRYAVRELNAHAWVEAYFPQYGWIEFEPTPSELPFDRADAAASDTSGSDSTRNPNGREDSGGLAGRDNEPDPGLGGVDDTPPDVSGSVSRQVDPRPALALVSALLLALFIALVRFEMRFRGLGEIDTAWGQTRLLGAYAGHAARPSQTPYEYADAMGREIPDIEAPMRTIAHARVQDRYAPTGATDSERAAAAAAWRRVARVFVTLLPTRIIRALAKLVR